MGHELSELFGMLGFGVGLAALCQRSGQLLLQRLGARSGLPLQSSARRPRTGVELDPERAASRAAHARRPDSTT